MNRICIVTGSNKGIGYGIVKELCKKMEGKVYLTSRDEKRGQDAIESLKREGLSPEYFQLDISDINSINNIASYLKKQYGGLHVLVNNAAIAYKRDATEPFGEQAENTLKVNYFDTKNVCEALFPLLLPNARVVNVSSSAGHLSRINGAEPKASALRQKLASLDLTVQELDSMANDFIRLAKEGTWYEEGWPNSAYCVSKVLLSALTRIQQRDFDADSRPGIVVNSCHPGYVDTDMTSHKGVLTIEQGAVCPVYLALLPLDESAPKGGYFGKDAKPIDWVEGEPII